MTDVLAAFPLGQHQVGQGWTARCPAHDDQRSSLSIGRGGDGRWLLKCHAGCELEDILAAAHLELADLFPDRPLETIEPTSAPRTETFDYQAEDGTVLFQVVRFPPKNFRQRAPDGTWSIKGIRRVPYRLPELKGCKTVMVVEGEKDANRLWGLGLPATTNAGGAGKWQSEYASLLKQAGCHQVVVLPDNDPTGEAHGRDVARSCADATLAVKLISLPGLARKGDVSDYLQHHSKDDLLALVKGAPLFTPRRLVAAEQPMTLTSLADLLDEPDDQIEWNVEHRIASGSSELLAAPPKSGKSHLSRDLAFSVSRGEPWLGWPTTQGTVWMFVLEDKRSEVKKHFKRMGADGTEPIRLFIGQAPVDLLPQLHALAEKERPALIIVDTLARALRVKDFNDYAQVTQAFEPLLQLTRATGATLVLLHHGSAHQAREGLDAVLGSTALSGSVDNILILKRIDQQRVLSSVQRIGPDLEPTVITLNPDTGRLELAGTKREFDDRDLSARILAAIGSVPNPVSEAWIQEHVEGRNTEKVRVLRRVLGMKQVHRTGAGGRKDPYRYTLASSCSRESTNPVDVPDTREQELAPMNPGLFPAFESSCSHVPYKEQREQEQKSVVRTPVRPSSNYVPVPEVPVVPERFTNNGNGASTTLNTPRKHAANSCSHEDDVERF